jgi:hypothetical protein
LGLRRTSADRPDILERIRAFAQLLSRCKPSCHTDVIILQHEPAVPECIVDVRAGNARRVVGEAKNQKKTRLKALF